MNLHLGQALTLIAGIIGLLQRDGLLDAQGNFASPLSLDAITRCAADVEALLKTYGLQVDAKLDQIIAALPILLKLAGVR